jgi:hypothetical protein
MKTRRRTCTVESEGVWVDDQLVDGQERRISSAFGPLGYLGANLRVSGHYNERKLVSWYAGRAGSAVLTTVIEDGVDCTRHRSATSAALSKPYLRR